MDQAALDEAARLGLARGDFEESEEEGAAVVDEFYVQEDEAIDQVSMPSKPSLADKLHQKAGEIRSPAGQGDSV